jgi:hypothetical protein
MMPAGVSLVCDTLSRANTLAQHWLGAQEHPRKWHYNLIEHGERSSVMHMQARGLAGQQTALRLCHAHQKT